MGEGARRRGARRLWVQADREESPPAETQGKIRMRGIGAVASSRIMAARQINGGKRRKPRPQRLFKSRLVKIVRAGKSHRKTVEALPCRHRSKTRPTHQTIMNAPVIVRQSDRACRLDHKIAVCQRRFGSDAGKAGFFDKRAQPACKTQTPRAAGRGDVSTFDHPCGLGEHRRNRPYGRY